MPNNHWMVVQTPENHAITIEKGFRLHGLTSKQRRRARRMEPDDRILYYVGGNVRKWTATAIVISKYFEDTTPIWKSYGSRNELFPFRVEISPSIVLDERDYIEAVILAPRMEYLKRWSPEMWPLAFFETLHLIPQQDYRLIEGEMLRNLRRRGRPRRPRECSRSEQRAWTPRPRKPASDDGDTPQPQGEAITVDQTASGLDAAG